MQTRLETARALLRAGNLSGARRDIEDALSRDPHDADALLLLAQLTDRETGPDAAVEVLERAMANAPNRLDLRMEHVGKLAKADREHDMADAIDALRRDFVYVPQVWHFWSGVWEVRYGHAAYARNHLRALRERGGWETLAEALEGAIDAGGTDFTRAEERLKETLARGSVDAATLAELALAQFFNMRFGQARRTAQAALGHDPREGTARAVLTLLKIVRFPPFLFAQAALLPGGGAAAQGRGPLARVFLGWLDAWLIAILMAMVTLLAFFPSILTGAFLLLMLACWFGWTPLMVRILRRNDLTGAKAKAIEISGY